MASKVSSNGEGPSEKGKGIFYIHFLVIPSRENTLTFVFQPLLAPATASSSSSSLSRRRPLVVLSHEVGGVVST